MAALARSVFAGLVYCFPSWDLVDGSLKARKALKTEWVYMLTMMNNFHCRPWESSDLISKFAVGNNF